MSAPARPDFYRGPALADVLREAALLVAGVASGRSMSSQLPHSARGANRAALLDITQGTLRAYRVGPVTVALLSRRPAGQPLDALLWCALYALSTGRYAGYTVVDQAVRASVMLGRAAAKGYVNGVLRAYLRRQDSIDTLARADPEANERHPAWWIAELRAAYPGEWRRVIAAGNSHPPMCLRVNLRKTTPDAYRAKLAAQGVVSDQVGETALLLQDAVPVERLPGFAQGEVSVQDAGAQHAAALLDLADGQRVLDACAAPGGKTGHIAERASVSLTALDIEPVRCALVRDNLQRLGLNAAVQLADAAAPDAWWNGMPYHRVLADVACSSSGIARRRPDIKWLRRAQDIPAYAARQLALLGALWRVLAANGKLLYATCSVFPAENEGVIEKFVAATPGAQRLDVPGGGQILPDDGHDGFFYALLEKRS